MRVRVKVCGITSYQDAALALDLGADALGFNFYPPSPRFIDFFAARDIICRLPPLATTVGVFVNVADPADVDESARVAGVQALQLHGDESADYCRRLGAWPLIKAVRVGKATVLENLREFPAQAFLLDSRDERRFGGTGKSFDWTLARGPVEGLRIILAGGLSAANVAEAIRIVQPYGLDVCSSVESRPGKKDAARLTAFMNEVFDATR
ncbi:MAG: phosphoribosylanthranilate isomerase [Acidobacteriia bacterium]|nr:phosphoribosylanthranilate isomerase [Terriglobia bacterium]